MPKGWDGVNTHVVAGGITRNSGAFIGDHVRSLRSSRDRIDYIDPSRPFSFTTFHLVNDSGIETELALSRLEAPYISIETEGKAFGWKRGEYNIPHLAVLRNLWVKYALSLHPKATHLWMVDSDVFPDPDCLERLLSAQAEYEIEFIAAPVRNSATTWNFRVPGEERREKRFIELLGGDVPFLVEGTGACILMPAEEGIEWVATPRGEFLAEENTYLMPTAHTMHRGRHSRAGGSE